VIEPDPAGSSTAPDAGPGETFPLPARVRTRLVELAASVLGELDEGLTPAALARVRLFAPARRARAGAAPLALALDRDASFRTHVAAAWRALHPEHAKALDAGADLGADDPSADDPSADDPVDVLAGLYLLRPPGWTEAAALAVRRLARADEESARLEAEGAADARVRGLERQMEYLRGELAEARNAADAAQEELVAARREIRRLRANADRARASARAAELEGEAQRARADAAVARAEHDLARERDRSRLAEERAEQALRAGREGRSLADARVRLLLDTLVEAASGLRRELAVPPLDVRPADLVGAAGQDEAARASGSGGRGQEADESAGLAELLALPQAHLIVDGYNVTKTGFGTLPLVEQRRRLVDALAPLTARTGAEVTCVFDGAEVNGGSAQRRRGVRVLFSEPGVSADDLIRRLVRAEPRGRPVVVVSSDNEVAGAARAAGARAVPATALLRLLARA
jgi:predicted RNA-binding protein with PIN domain